MILVSACLAGVNCKYNGGNNYNSKIAELVENGQAIPVCPEQLGGCPTPRVAAEITGGTGEDVLAGKAHVVRKGGKVATGEFIKGASEVLKLAELIKAEKVILKAKSPSCGCGEIYDGSFTGKLIAGNGVTTELLKKNGFTVITEKEL